MKKRPDTFSYHSSSLRNTISVGCSTFIPLSRYRLPGIAGPIPSAALDKDYISDYTNNKMFVNPFPQVFYLYPIITNRSMKKTSNNKTPFMVIKGGAADSHKTASDLFIMAEATNTRLMGVVGLHMRYMSYGELIDLFFYLDYEEYGLDEFSMYGDSGNTFIELEKSNKFGALGGTWVQLTEREASRLVTERASFNKRLHMILPVDGFWLSKLAANCTFFSANEEDTLMNKICVPLDGPYMLINYYIMRCAGNDKDAALYLSADKDNAPCMLFHAAGTLYSCTIRKKGESYSCETVTGLRNAFFKIILNISISDMKITSCREVTRLKISPWESYLTLKRYEYIVVSQVKGDISEVHRIISSLSKSMTSSIYETGTLFMFYKKDNSHVGKRKYRLDEDTVGQIFLSEGGEIIFASRYMYETSALKAAIELNLEGYSTDLEELMSIKFDSPVLGTYIESGYSSFDDFIKYLQEK